MDYNVVSNYHEFLNQMESCGFNDNQITLEATNSNHDRNDTYHSPSPPVLLSRPTSLTDIPNVSGSTPPNEDLLLKWSKLKSSPQPPSHGLNLNLHRDINSYYDNLTGLIYRIPFHNNHDNNEINDSITDHPNLVSNRSSFTFLPEEYHSLFPKGISSTTPPPSTPPRSSSPFKLDMDFMISPILNGSRYLGHEHDEFEDDGYFSDDNENEEEDTYDDGYEDYDDVIELNPIMPGLFPKMEISDDEKFMKFDKLPLTPSFVSK